MNEQAPRTRLWTITVGAFLAAAVCWFVPVGWTSLHSVSALHVFAELELAVGLFGLLMLFRNRRGRS